MNIRLLALVAALLFSTYGIAQEKEDTAPTKRLMFGGGSSNVMDTYLSPYAYKKNSGRIDLIFETLSPKSNLSQLDVHISTMQNPAENVREYDFGLSLKETFHCFHWQRNAFSLHTGPMAYLYLGGLYNDRNGNNPAQGRLSLMADISVLLSYNFKGAGKPMQLEYTLDVPLVGLAFSPQFGQSYYEIFALMNYDHNCVFAHCFNTPSLRHRLLVETSIGKLKWYIGYNGLLEQAIYNGLRYHSYSHSVILGWKL